MIRRSIKGNFLTTLFDKTFIPLKKFLSEHVEKNIWNPIQRFERRKGLRLKLDHFVTRFNVQNISSHTSSQRPSDKKIDIVFRLFPKKKTKFIRENRI